MTSAVHHASQSDGDYQRLDDDASLPSHAQPSPSPAPPSISPPPDPDAPDTAPHPQSPVPVLPLTPSSRPATPLPKVQVALIGLILYAATFPQNVLFPFLPFMVAHFNPELPTSELGYRAGVIASAFSVGMVFSSYWFGRLADRYGRKGCVCVGLLGTVVSSVLFGMSPNFAVAVFARFLAGLSGNNGLAKTMISEITDDSNSAIAFALVGAMDGLARLSAPSVGGFGSQPNKEYGWDVDFFEQFPFFLPCFVSAMVSLIALAFVIPLLRETLPASIRLANTRHQVREAHRRSAHALPAWVLEQDALEEAAEQASKERRSVGRLLRHREIRIMVSLNAILMVLALVINEGLPLWVVNDEEHFGFSFSSAAIGAVFTVLGPMQSLTQLLIYPRVSKRKGYLWTFRYCLAMVGVFCMLIPFTFYLSFSRVLVWVGLVGAFVLLVLHRSSAFTTCFVVLNNVCTDELKASANGLAMSVASLAGVVSPIVGGSLLAWSIDAGFVWPFDHSMMWTFCAAVCAVGWYLVGLMPQSANKKLEKPKAQATDGTELSVVTTHGGEHELNGMGKVHEANGVNGVKEENVMKAMNGVNGINGVNGHHRHQQDDDAKA